MKVLQIVSTAAIFSLTTALSLEVNDDHDEYVYEYHQARGRFYEALIDALYPKQISLEKELWGMLFDTCYSLYSPNHNNWYEKDYVRCTDLLEMTLEDLLRD